LITTLAAEGHGGADFTDRIDLNLPAPMGLQAQFCSQAFN